MNDRLWNNNQDNNNNTPNRTNLPCRCLVLRLAGFTFAMKSSISCSSFGTFCGDLRMSDTDCFTTSFPHALAEGVVAVFVCWLTAIIDFTGNAKRSPHDTRKHHDWLWRTRLLLCHVNKWLSAGVLHHTRLLKHIRLVLHHVSKLCHLLHLCRIFHHGL